MLAAIKEAGFQADAPAQRMIILIGDDGDKSDEADPHSVQVDRVVDALLDGGRKPIFFAAIQVVQPPKNNPFPRRAARPKTTRSEEEQASFPVRSNQGLEENQKSLKKQQDCAAWAFKVQVEAIRDKLNAHEKEFGMTLGSYQAISGPGASGGGARDLTAALNSVVSAAQTRMNDLETEFQRYQARQFHTRIEPRFLSILRDMNAPVTSLRDLPGVRVGRGDGFAWRWARGGVRDASDPGTPQLRLRVMLSVGEIDRLLRELAPILSEPDDGRALDKLKAIAGVGSFEEKVLRPLGLPARSELLTAPPGGVGTKAALGELAGIRKRAAALRALRSVNDGPKADSRYFAIAEKAASSWCWADHDEELP